MTRLASTAAGLFLTCLLIAAMPRTVRAETPSWQQAQADVTPTGDLRWAPREFAFAPGQAVRYIDYDAGDDDNAGTSTRSPWKHHPWDPAATGKAKACRAADTFVFKRGVTYRGRLVADRSGQDDRPIQLTSDPAWGQGDARFYGSERLDGPWKRADAASAPGIPDPRKVWYMDLPGDWSLAGLWIDDPAGKEIVRIHLARNPDWQVVNTWDPQIQWNAWEKTVRRGNLCTDSDALAGKPKDFFDGAHVWTEWNGNMGSVHRRRVESYDPQTGTLKLSRVSNPSPIAPNNRYYVENVPGYLDTPGEYYVSTGGRFPRRLYVRLPDDRNPNDAIIEAARTEHLLHVVDRSHIHVSGIRFSFNADPLTGDWPKYLSNPSVVMVEGDCRDIRVSHCRFLHVGGVLTAHPRMDRKYTGIYMKNLPEREGIDRLDGIAVTDCDISRVSHAGCITVVNGRTGIGRVLDPDEFGRLGKVSILRNRIDWSGFRSGVRSYSNIAAITCLYPEHAEIAGNVIDMCWGTGIFTHGGKPSGCVSDAPLTRILIHHNKITNSVLATNDWGGISPWQGGPIYLYNNISGNAMGYKSAAKLSSDWKTVAYNLYLDGTFKTYTFNNVVWGIENDPAKPYRNRGSYFVVLGFMDHLFNNTFYKFRHGIVGSSGNRSWYLGNVVAEMSGSFIQQNRKGDTSLRGGGDSGAHGQRGVPSLAFVNNVFCGDASAGNVGRIRGNTVEQLRDALKKVPIVNAQLGWQIDEIPLANPEQHNFALTPGSFPVDKGVKFFAPWGLYAMVGEWNFYRNHNDPTEVIGENFYMTPAYLERHMYDLVPRNALTVPGATLDTYVDGDLEDWTAGALRFDGKTTYALLADKDLKAGFQTPYRPDMINQSQRLKKGKYTYPGPQRKTVDMDTNNFLIEIYFRADKGTDGVLVSKRHDGDRRGYQLWIDDGSGTLTFAALSGDHRCALRDGPKVNDGRWHHVIAELDRQGKQMRLYLDGKLAKKGACTLPAEAPLSNSGDFLVGKGLDGDHFTGEIDFLRVARGTLADARTTIEELYAWQFDGPFLRDFAGRKPVGKRDAGALEQGTTARSAKRR
jgi:hypothetical protein